MRMPLTSADVLGDRIEHLRNLFPEGFVEGSIDFDRLRSALGDFVGEGKERYGLSWAGKADAIRAIQAPSVGTLVPCPEESVNFDTTENLFIEGDNLEVLKLLQKSYYGKVKMIYIDPPYNTGNEFIYPDNFREGLDDYLKYSGQVGEEGVRMSTNSETSGRYHSKWLDMMYPRLFLARNLLRDDGVFLASISEHELANLTLLLNEVFGEENYIGTLVWKSRQFPDSRAKTRVSTDHEYIVAYARTAFSGFRGIERDESKFSNPDDDSRGPWMSRSILGLATAEQRPNLHFEITDPDTAISYAPPPNTGWRYGQERMAQLINTGCILFPAKEDGRPREKKFRKDLENEFVSFPSIIDDVFTSHGTAEIRDLFGYQAFDFPKPSELLRRFVEQLAGEDDVVLDFFAGSASMAHGVILQSQKDGMNRKMISIQLPEPIKEDSELATHGIASIAQVGAERLRLVKRQLDSKQVSKESMLPSESVDVGFRLLKLRASNFKIWDGSEDTNPEALQSQLELFADHVLPDRSEQDVLYELLLKAGLPLTAAIEEKAVAEQKVYSIAEGLLFICLANPITQECLRGMGELEPERIICLDAAFGGNDQLKTNTVLEMKSHGIEFRTV
ncbi:site-specific DNA-methyltransferase [Botrimarina mediterranea]|uniref:site-specific DNA-methyltransferase n=1 Tax=Botrimarina mediterranea TaxID=2528022 RepID=UPI003AF31DF0